MLKEEEAKKQQQTSSVKVDKPVEKRLSKQSIEVNSFEPSRGSLGAKSVEKPKQTELAKVSEA